jgi:hypothetical protein
MSKVRHLLQDVEVVLDDFDQSSHVHSKLLKGNRVR